LQHEACGRACRGRDRDRGIRDGDTVGADHAAGVGEDLFEERIVRRDDKTGFPVPYREWVAAQLGPQVRALLGSEASLDRGVFNPRVLRDPWLSPEEMLTMLNIEVWYRVFIDRDPAWLPTEPGAGRTSFAGLPPLPAW